MTLAPGAIDQSAEKFIASCWPALAPWVDGGRLEPVPARRDGHGQTVDRSAGVDAWQVLPDGGVRGVAVRIQWPSAGLWRCICRDHGGGTFTVREFTEYPKLRHAIDHRMYGHVYPHLYCQGYAERDGTLISAGAALTRELIDYMTNPTTWALRDDLPRREHPDNGTIYVVVGWRELQRAGCTVVAV